MKSVFVETLPLCLTLWLQNDTKSIQDEQKRRCWNLSTLNGVILKCFRSKPLQRSLQKRYWIARFFMLSWLCWNSQQKLLENLQKDIANDNSESFWGIFRLPFELISRQKLNETTPFPMPWAFYQSNPRSVLVFWEKLNKNCENRKVLEFLSFDVNSGQFSFKNCIYIF